MNKKLLANLAQKSINNIDYREINANQLKGDEICEIWFLAYNNDHGTHIPC